MLKLIGKYKSLPVQIKASMWFLFSSFFQKGISVITTPIFTRLLSTTDYGQYSVFNSWLSIITVIVSLELYGGVYSRGLIKFADERKVFASSLQGLNLTLIASWTCIYLLFHSFWNQLFELTTVQMLAMLLLIWSSAAAAFWATEQRVDFKYRTLIIITMIVTVAKPIIGIVFVINAEDKATSRILGLALVNVIVYTGLFIVQMRKGKTFYSRKYWNHALLFNLPLVPHYLSQTILNGMDRIMIQRMVGASEAGIYNLAYSVSLIMTMFNTALLQTVEPWLYRKINDSKISDIVKVAYPCLIIIASVNIALIAFAPEVVSIFAPVEYYEAIWVIPPIAMSVFFMFTYNFFAVFQFYFEKTKLVTAATIIGALVNVILNYICIKIFGYYAAGYTTLLCYFLYALAHYILMKKICRDHLNGECPYNTKLLLLIVTVFMGISFIYLATYKNPIIRYSLSIIFTIILIVKRKHIIDAVRKIVDVKKK